MTRNNVAKELFRLNIVCGQKKSTDEIKIITDVWMEQYEIKSATFEVFKEAVNTVAGLTDFFPRPGKVAETIRGIWNRQHRERPQIEYRNADDRYIPEPGEFEALKEKITKRIRW